ncbi:MAG TPA: DUF2207 domain-containing protein [Gemmatimonadaceae bacterium]|nr:DUF2207 domain-containing protein [Gemmatimonadaceae bacterium]
MRTTARALVLIVALAFVPARDIPAQGKEIRIRDFTALLAVHPDGSLDVIEEITLHFTGQWNGILRDLSLQHNTAQGRKTKLDVNLAGITDRLGQPLRVEEETKDAWTKRFRIWIPGAVDADRTILIKYRVHNAIRFYFASGGVGAFDELYWNVTGNSWTMPIDRVHARVVLPNGAVATRTAVYTGARSATEKAATIERDGDEVGFTLTRGLSPYEGMTIGLGWPPGSVITRPSEARARLLDALQWSPVLIPFLILWLAYRAWDKRGRDPKEGSYVVRYEPVAGMTPAELGTLIDNSADMDDITATLVDLAVRGYIHITELTEERLLGLAKSTDYQLEILKPREQWSGLKPHERKYLEALREAALSVDPLTDGSKVKVSDLKDRFYKSLPKIRDAIYDSLVTARYYLSRPDKVQGKWHGLAVLFAIVTIGFSILSLKLAWVFVSPASLIASSVAGVVTLVIFAQIMPARTVEGAHAREATLGFQEFLARVDAERMKQMITSPEMFERYLPYAMAFGVEEKWAKAFESIYREPPQWYSGSYGQFSASNFSHSISSMSSAASSSMSSSPSSSGSGGGGSSGGGSGGGGGSGF